jgi:hypothetical protein
MKDTLIIIGNIMLYALGTIIAYFLFFTLFFVLAIAIFTYGDIAFKHTIQPLLEYIFNLKK